MTYFGNENQISLNYNSYGQLIIQLPQGPPTDAYRLYLSVSIIDDMGGFYIYNISIPVTVFPNDILANSFATRTSISSDNPYNLILLNLNSGNLNLLAKNVIGLATVFNIKSSSQLTQTNIDQMGYWRELMLTKLSVLSISDISRIKVLSSALSVNTRVFNQISSQSAVNSF